MVNKNYLGLTPEQWRWKLVEAAQVMCDNHERFPLNMQSYFSEGYDEKVKHPCESPACFAGSLPFTGVECFQVGPEDSLSVERGNNMQEYLGRRSIYFNDASFHWLFGSDWPNSHEQNLLRAKYFAIHGNSPKNWKGFTGEYPGNWEEIVEGLKDGC